MIKLKDLIGEVRGRKKTASSGLGRCYELAGRYVSTHPDTILVHGKLVNKFTVGMREVEHAWIEEGDEIIDLCQVENLKKLPKAVYEGLFQPVSLKKYSYNDVIRITTHIGHWGPWNDEEIERSKSGLIESV